MNGYMIICLIFTASASIEAKQKCYMCEYYGKEAYKTDKDMWRKETKNIDGVEGLITNLNHGAPAGGLKAIDSCKDPFKTNTTKSAYCETDEKCAKLIIKNSLEGDVVFIKRGCPKDECKWVYKIGDDSYAQQNCCNDDKCNSGDKVYIELSFTVVFMITGILYNLY